MLFRIIDDQGEKLIGCVVCKRYNSFVTLLVGYTQFTRIVDLLRLDIEPELDDDNFIGRLIPAFYFSNAVSYLRAVVQSVYALMKVHQCFV